MDREGETGERETERDGEREMKGGNSALNYSNNTVSARLQPPLHPPISTPYVGTVCPLWFDGGGAGNLDAWRTQQPRII